MTIQEMHIGLDLLLRKGNSNILQTLKPQQKDWLLNEGILTFIKARRNPRANPNSTGYQANRKRYDDLEAVQETLTLPVYKRDSESMFAILPYNYLLSDVDNSLVAWDCNDVTFTPTPETLYYCIVPLKAGGTTTPFYQGFKIEITDLSANTTTIFDIAIDAQLATGLNTNEEKFYLANLVIEKLNTIPGIECRWERWNDIFSNESFIIITKDPVTGVPVNNTSITITYFSGTTETINFTSKVETKYVNTISKTKYSPNRLTRSEDIRSALDDSFHATTYESPVSRIQKGKIIVYHSKRFILNSLELEYIRKPRKVNIDLGISCELDSAIHEEIVSLTAQKVMAVLQAKNYKEIINQNLIQE